MVKVEADLLLVDVTVKVESDLILLNVTVKAETDIICLDVDVVVFLLHHLVQGEDVVIPILGNKRYYYKYFIQFHMCRGEWS